MSFNRAAKLDQPRVEDERWPSIRGRGLPVGAWGIGSIVALVRAFLGGGSTTRGTRRRLRDQASGRAGDEPPPRTPATPGPIAPLIATRRSVPGGVTPSPHASRASGVLRPVVFGGNDGLVSNLALVMGVAGAAPAPGVIVLAGIAGLLAGAFSMAVGEYVSVQSQRELLEYQIEFQKRQLATTPETERDILIDIYVSRGFTRDEATQIADRMFADPARALDALVREEIGLDPRAIGSPWSAAGGSFLAFTLGALVPVVPYLLGSGAVAFWTSLLASLAGLFVLGIGVSQFTHRAPLRTGIRQVLLGLAAAGVTYAVGTLVGAAGI